MRLHPCLLLCVMVLSATSLASAKIEEWKDINGNVLNAEPVEVLGPFALFRTQAGGGTRLPWRVLAPVDCVRFQQQLGTKSGPAATWAEANGSLTGRLRGYLRQFVSVNAFNADLTALPEPELLIVFYIDNSVSGSLDMVRQSIPYYKTLLEKHPGEAAGIQFGAYHSPQQHTDLAVSLNIPWLLVEHSEQRRLLDLLNQSPGRNDFALFALSRDGVPIFAVNNPDEVATKQFFADADVLLGLLHPGNPLAWPDRAHYLSALQLERHRQDQSGPVLVGDPLVPKGLRERSIFRVDAKIEVGADGKASAVTVKEDGSVSAPMVAALAKALQRSSVFVPAVDHGQFVAGTYDYHLELKP